MSVDDVSQLDSGVCGLLKMREDPVGASAQCIQGVNVNIVVTLMGLQDQQ